MNQPLPAGQHDDLIRRLASIRRQEAEAAMTPEQKASNSLHRAFRKVTDRAIDQLKSNHHQRKP